MDSKSLTEWGPKVLEFVAQHWENQRNYKPQPDVVPNYMRELIPANPPNSPEEWQKVLDDFEKVIVSGHALWSHPHFFGYFPTAVSSAAIIADILGAGLNGVGFTWKSCPSMSELESITMDWLVDWLNLPRKWKHSEPGPGCGVIQSTSSDATMIAFLAARARAIDRKRVHLETIEEDDPEIFVNPYHDPRYFDKFIAYCSDQAHSAIPKAAMMCGIRLRKLKSEKDKVLGNFSISAETLEAAIAKDKALGRVPIILVATIGTTGTCGVDPIPELGPICQREGIWLHVDAAYAGSFMICPEFSYLSKGLELVDSFNMNAHKTLLVNFDCSPMWFSDARSAVKYFNVDISILKHEHEDETIDYRHFQIALGRRFRSLKVWFVMRLVGKERIQNILRKQCAQADRFAKYIESSSKFEFLVPKHLGLVTFKLKNGTNADNEKLAKLLNEDRRVLLTPASGHGTFFLRLAVCSQQTTDDDIDFAYKVIEELAAKV